EDIFFEDYYKALAYNNLGDPGHTLPGESSGTYVPVKPSPLSLTEYMEVIPVFSPNNSYAMLSSLIANATTTIDVQQQYFSFTCDLVDDLIDAAKKGISIRVMVPEPTTATNNVTETLLSNGIDIRWSKSLYNHNKFLLVDGEIVSVTSINWSNGSVDDNRESGAIVKNTNIATYLGDVFENDWENLTEIPTGFLPAVEIVSPEPNVVAENTIQIEVGLYLATYTTAELYLNDTLIHTWTNPSSTATFNLDTTLYSDGMKTLKLKATTSTAQILEEELVFNIINAADWWLLITEVRWDAVTEPEGEFFELYNGFAFDVAIGTWEVTDGEGTYVIPDGTTFESEDILIFVRDETTYTTEMTNLGVTFFAPDFIYADILLANTGDELMLSIPGGDVVDEVAWGTSASTTVTPWTGDMDDTLSLQRDPANYDTDDCTVDFTAGSPNPGTVYIKTSKTFSGFALFSTLSAIIFTTIIMVKRKRK
ncbi:MAG TPA: phospholipase D-like domain-containing protein, partial [candidate division Zixibacteria bacterium]|nr:phospholipase D-like domain-containing protein [candidate division Zixibacteria bacterium]